MSRLGRDLLPRTFGPWFARFAQPTEVQERGIPPVRAGRDVLLCSPTASGKTEAYAAPAAELALDLGAPSACVLVVSPTRALANDLRRRLEGPMELVGLSFGRYTGEHKERTAGALPAAVVTTPEALDSLLARRASQLANVRMIVLDELHVLDGTPRGDHLRILLERLQHVAGARPQRVAASATVDRPAEFAARYLADAELVVVEGPKRILGRAFAGVEIGDVARHLDELAGHGFRKVLVFCRSRNQVETLATKLRGRTVFEERVFAHHGSLGRSVRERNERLFLHAAAAVCFATTTLEMGIDVGTVDYVLLVGLPGDVASLLQRVGRGSRRGDATRAGFAVTSAAQEHVFRTMFALAKRGELCSPPYAFRPSVLVQQALVLACGHDWVERSELEAALPADVRRELGDAAVGALLDALVGADLLERAGGGRFVATAAIEARWERGYLHSNVDEQASVEVVDRLTGDVIGKVRLVESSDVEIAGRERRVVHGRPDRLLTDAGADARPARFRSAAPPSTSLALARAIVEALGVEPGAVALVRAGGGALVVHGLGTYGALLCAYALGAEVASTTAFTARLGRTGELADLPRPSDDEAALFVDEHLDAIEKTTSPGPFVVHVPRDLRVAAAVRVTGIAAAAAFLRDARLVELEPTAQVAAILVDL